LNGRSKDPILGQVVQEAILCKLFSCRPSELREEKFEDVLMFSAVYNEIAKKNPMALFM